MAVILGLLNSIFDITLVAAGIFCVMKFIEFRKSIIIKNEIQILQARVSLLRMALKSKVKKKANSFRSKFVRPINTGDPIDIAIGNLTDNKFEKGEDFQNYFDLSKEINGYINTEVKLTTDIATNKNTGLKFEDFMGPDLKNEVAIVRTIKDIVETSSKFNAKALGYNKRHPKTQMTLLDQLQFPALNDVNRVVAETNDLALPEVKKNEAA